MKLEVKLQTTTQKTFRSESRSAIGKSGRKIFLQSEAEVGSDACSAQNSVEPCENALYAFFMQNLVSGYDMTQHCSTFGEMRMRIQMWCGKPAGLWREAVFCDAKLRCSAVRKGCRTLARSCILQYKATLIRGAKRPPNYGAKLYFAIQSCIAPPC